MAELLTLQGEPLNPSTYASSLPTLIKVGEYVQRHRKQGLYHAFISHRVSSDRQSAERIYQHLSSIGLHPYLDQVCIPPGEPWRPAFLDGLRRSDCVVILLSDEGMVNPKSDLVDHSRDNLLLEIELALGLRKSILPLFVQSISGAGFIPNSGIYSDHIQGIIPLPLPAPAPTPPTRTHVLSPITIPPSPPTPTPHPSSSLTPINRRGGGGGGAVVSSNTPSVEELSKQLAEARVAQKAAEDESRRLKEEKAKRDQEVDRERKIREAEERLQRQREEEAQRLRGYIYRPRIHSPPLLLPMHCPSYPYS